LSPDAFRTVRRPSGPIPMSRTMPQPTPQYEQTVRTCVVGVVVVTQLPFAGLLRSSGPFSKRNLRP
jgi:hypothetical protein